MSVINIAETEMEMKMKVLRLRKEETYYFAWLDPFDYLDRLSLPHYFALAGLEKTGKEDVPTALLVASMSGNNLVIEWLCVDPDKRQQGYGSAMVQELFSIAKRGGIGQVSLRVREEDEMTALWENAADFFGGMFFDREEELPGELRAELFPLSGSAYFQEAGENVKRLKAGEEIRPIRECKAAVLKEAIHTLWNKEEAFRLYEIACNPGEYDKELSMALLRKDRICGLILFHSTENACYPAFFYAESDADKKMLLRAALDAAADQLEGDTEIRFISDTPEHTKLAETIFDTKKINTRCYVA